MFMIESRSHISKLFVGLILLAPLFVTGCATTAPQKTSLELQAFQSREFETDYKVAFSSVISVFQDLGYIIEEGSADTGLISAKSTTKEGMRIFVGKVMAHRDASAFVEAMPSGMIRIRLNFVDAEETSSGYGMKGGKSVAVENPALYQETFEKIQKAIFVRTATT